MTTLLDSSMLIAAAFADHQHNAAADQWLDDFDDRYATCPITEGALLRTALRIGFSIADGVDLLGQITASDRCDFWPEDIGYADVALAGVVGHRQVTDAYLAQLARHNNGRIATLDKGFAALHSDVTDLIPTEE